jgi:branched-chain amino acid transport system permease protein
MELLQLLISGLSQGCVYGLIALGFVLIYKATEMVNFAQGDLMMLGAFLAFTFINLAGLPFGWGLLCAIAAMAAIGVLLERVVLRPMIGEPPFAVLMITIGLGFVLRAGAGAVWGNEPRSIASPFAGGVLRLGEASVGYENLAIIGGTALLCLALYVFFRFTHLGVAMQAASQNQLAAFYCGIPVKRVFSIVWALSAAISAAAAIVGGFGSFKGAMAGGLLIGVAEQLAGLYLPTGFSDTSAYVILLLMLFVRPEGLFATMQRKKV